MVIESNLLTLTESNNVFDLFEENNKLIDNNPWKLIFDSNKIHAKENNLLIKF